MQNSDVFNSITIKNPLKSSVKKQENHFENWDANMSSFYLIRLGKDRKFLQGKAGRRQ